MDRVALGRPVVASGRPAGARRAARGAAAAPAALEVSTGAVPRGGRSAAVVPRRAGVEDAFAARARLANGPQTFPLAARVSRECGEWHESDGWYCSGAADLTCGSPCHGDAGSGGELAAEARDRDRWCFRAVSEPWIHGTEVTRWDHNRNERRWRSDGGSWRRTQCRCGVVYGRRRGPEWAGGRRLGFEGGRNWAWICGKDEAFARDVVAARIRNYGIGWGHCRIGRVCQCRQRPLGGGNCLRRVHYRAPQVGQAREDGRPTAGAEVTGEERMCGAGDHLGRHEKILGLRGSLVHGGREKDGV